MLLTKSEIIIHNWFGFFLKIFISGFFLDLFAPGGFEQGSSGFGALRCLGPLSLSMKEETVSHVVNFEKTGRPHCAEVEKNATSPGSTA